MAWIHPIAVAHRRKMHTRHDAWRLAPWGTPEAKMPGWLDPSATRVRLKEAQEEEARAAFEAEVKAAQATQDRLCEMLAELNYDLAWRKLLRKYSPTQPRVPAGNSDGGQWTSGMGSLGAAAAGDRPVGDTPPTGQRVRLAQLAAPGGTLSDANPPRFSPDRPGWHEYPAGPNLACRAELQCSRKEMTDQLTRFSLPGRDPSMPIEDGRTYSVFIPGTDVYVGDVRTRITEDGLAIANQTKEGHIFFDGAVVRRLTQSDDGAWYVTTHGFGNNVEPGAKIANELAGPEVFNELDRQMRANIERHHAKGVVLDLAVHRVDGSRHPGSGQPVLGARHEIA